MGRRDNMSYRYEINSLNEVRVWNVGEEAPFALQPDWPDGTPWASAEEATAWAELYIESLEDPTSEFVPGESPDTPRKPRPAAESE